MEKLSTWLLLGLFWSQKAAPANYSIPGTSHDTYETGGLYGDSLVGQIIYQKPSILGTSYDSQPLYPLYYSQPLSYRYYSQPFDPRHYNLPPHPIQLPANLFYPCAQRVIPASEQSGGVIPATSAILSQGEISAFEKYDHEKHSVSQPIADESPSQQAARIWYEERPLDCGLMKTQPVKETQSLQEVQSVQDMDLTVSDEMINSEAQLSNEIRDSMFLPGTYQSWRQMNQNTPTSECSVKDTQDSPYKCEQMPTEKSGHHSAPFTSQDELLDLRRIILCPSNDQNTVLKRTNGSDFSNQVSVIVAPRTQRQPDQDIARGNPEIRNAAAPAGNAIWRPYLEENSETSDECTQTLQREPSTAPTTSAFVPSNPVQSSEEEQQQQQHMLNDQKQVSDAVLLPNSDNLGIRQDNSGITTDKFNPLHVPAARNENLLPAMDIIDLKSTPSTEGVLQQLFPRIPISAPERSENSFHNSNLQKSQTDRNKKPHKTSGTATELADILQSSSQKTDPSGTNRVFLVDLRPATQNKPGHYFIVHQVPPDAKFSALSASNLNQVVTAQETGNAGISGSHQQYPGFGNSQQSVQQLQQQQQQLIQRPDLPPVTPACSTTHQILPRLALIQAVQPVRNKPIVQVTKQFPAARIIKVRALMFAETSGSSLLSSPSSSSSPRKSNSQSIRETTFIHTLTPGASVQQMLEQAARWHRRQHELPHFDANGDGGARVVYDTRDGESTGESLRPGAPENVDLPDWVQPPRPVRLIKLMPQPDGMQASTLGTFLQQQPAAQPVTNYLASQVNASYPVSQISPSCLVPESTPGHSSQQPEKSRPLTGPNLNSLANITEKDSTDVIADELPVIPIVTVVHKLPDNTTDTKWLLERGEQIVQHPKYIVSNPIRPTKSLSLATTDFPQWTYSGMPQAVQVPMEVESSQLPTQEVQTAGGVPFAQPEDPHHRPEKRVVHVLDDPSESSKRTKANSETMEIDQLTADSDPEDNIPLASRILKLL